MTSVQLAQSEIDAVQETLLGEALEHAPVGALVLDERGRFLAANRMACQVTGYSRSELLDLTSADLAVEPATVAVKLEEMASGQLERGTGLLRCKDGSAVAMDYRVGATRSGGLPYFVLVFWEREEPQS
jgi:PAS domain S-box-containing protein